ncbi:hypothetical protein F5B19DRAFT_491093 [Rostrohypoxylon terebratum]|nr:hypothetical protein F5B19DRAFT_491093 [Rostrohypoxylon terebratum]
MSSSNEGLSHNEIWDDSALVNSWNDALEEYKKYHSIHRNGGNVEDLLKTSNAKTDTQEAGHPSSSHSIKTDPEMRGEASNGRQEDGTSTFQHSHPHGGTPGPQGLLGSVRDEGLKRLLMSWYYAGYYTGLYEGQQNQSQQREPEQS